MNEKGMKELITAIYRQAARDYIKAYLTDNHAEMREIREFFQNWPYLKPPNRGIETILALEREINTALALCESFLESEKILMLFDRKEVILSVLYDVVQYKYPGKIKRWTDKSKRDYYLLRVGK